MFYKLNIEHLPRKGKHRKRKEKVPRQHKRLDNALHSIELRPSIVNGRLEFGHWEGDTIATGVKKSKYCLLTLTERSTRQEIVRKIPSKEASSVCAEFNKIERELGTDNFVKIFKTITFDNGCEFSDINGIETSYIIPTRKRTMVYFAHPYVASDRGSNENGNGILRRFISKGSDIAKYTKKVIRQIQEWINTYPRKIFSGKSSIEELISRNVLPFSCLSALLKI